MTLRTFRWCAGGFVLLSMWTYRARADEETTRGQNVQESADEAPSGILGWLSERGLDVSFGLTQIFQQ
ncbi:MAG: hypothetical protein V2A58_15010, partial [Planctomycetota bacterium]